MNYIAIMNWIGWVTWIQIVFNAALFVVLLIAIKKRIVIKLYRTSREEAIAELFYLAKKHDIEVNQDYSSLYGYTYKLRFSDYSYQYAKCPHKALKIVKAYIGLIRRDIGEKL